MYDWLNYLGTEHRDAFIPETEKDIIIREALAARQPKASRYREVMLAVGQQLSTWGEAMQQRYDDARMAKFERDAANEPC